MPPAGPGRNGAAVRLASADFGHGPRITLVEGERLRDTGIAEPLADLLDARGLARIAEAAARGAARPLEPGRLLPPVTPRAIVGVGLNYRAHAAEQGRALPAEPPLFLKHARALNRPFGPVPAHLPSLDYEAELGVVIGRPVFYCSAAEAEAAIAGWCIVQDYTWRALLRPETLPLAKGGPGMAPIGPWLTLRASLPDAGALRVRCRVNGELRQDSTTADMHVGPAALVQYIARHLPLGPGDVIATGSPGGSGVGFDPPRWLVPGDVVETEIEGLGRMRQEIVAAQA
jgi:2-keto-4-pentenoate hydratase/2-oxohepta-3-ene-1,7-dioic acid hydratase in catechol pathway